MANPNPDPTIPTDEELEAMVERCIADPAVPGEARLTIIMLQGKLSGLEGFCKIAVNALKKKLTL